MYDILFTASTYKSAQNALCFIKSICQIEGNHICTVVSPLQSDIDEIVTGLANAGDVGCRVIVFRSTVDHLYQSRGWGFVWAVANGIQARYLCSCDDDIEFTENSQDIVRRLNINRYSIMAFSSNVHGYRFTIGDIQGHDNITTDIGWINGDAMFSHFEDNLKYGVPDALLTYPVSYFTEIEYQHRMSCLTGEWMKVDARKTFYLHHFRNNSELNSLRGQHAIVGMSVGKQLWKEKYGIDLGVGHTFDCQALYQQVSTMPEKMEKHFIFHGLWNDWGEIYNRISPQFILAVDTGSK